MGAVIAPISQAKEVRESWWTARPARRFRKNPLALVGLFIAVCFTLMAVFAPLLATPKGNCLRDLDVPQGTSVYNPLAPLFWKSIFVPLLLYFAYSA